MSSSVLLSPLTIRKTTLRNRIMLPSMVTHYCAVNGEVSERLIAYHAERAPTAAWGSTCSNPPAWTTRAKATGPA